MRIEASILKINKIKFSSNSKGLKIAHISDIHINRLFISPERILHQLDKNRPDIILLTGDYIEKEKEINRFISLLKLFTDRYPVYLCMGNHDYKAFKRSHNLSSYIVELEKAGATVLINSNIKINKGGSVYSIIGIDDIRYGRPDIEQSLAGVTRESINIVISHSPDIALSLHDSRLDYLFCGHFHGGQIWMPFNLEFRILRKDQLGKKGIIKGLHKMNGINMYINRGIGNVSLPLRFLSVPEIAIIQLP
jgi:predicted MPP superfamily phosphohydrolase